MTLDDIPTDISGNDLLDNDSADDGFEQAERALLQAVAESPSHDPARIQPLRELADLYWSVERFDDAEAMLGEARHIGRRLVDEATERLRTLDSELELLRGARLLSDGRAARSRGEFDAAEKLVTRSLAIFEREEGESHPDIANILGELSQIHIEQARYAEAEECALRANEIVEGEEIAESDDPSVMMIRLQAVRNLGDIYRVLGRYHDAEPHLLRAISLAEEALGADHLEVSTCLNSLGILYKYSGNFDEADRVYHRALAIVEHELGPDHGDVASIYHNLGGLEHARGRYELAEAPARKSVEIRRAALGDDHPSTAADMAALASILQELEKFDEAEALYAHALAVFERVYGPEHYEMAINFNNLGMIAHHRGNFERAKELYTRALELKEKLLGPTHPDLAMTLNNLAVLYDELGDQHAGEGEGKRIARGYYERALAIFEATLDPDHPKIQLVRDNLQGIEADNAGQ